ncbi:MAG: LTA synthase family protein, partial [Rubrobacter sp.]
MFRSGAALLERKTWVYLIALLLPLFLYTASLRVVSFIQGDEGWIGFLVSDLPFNLGFLIFWVGVFMVFRGRVPGFVSCVLLHASVILIIVISTCAFQYLATTGTTLDYSIVSYYLSAPEEATGAVSSESGTAVWVALTLALLYSLGGPTMVARYLTKNDGQAENRPDATPDEAPEPRTMTRGRFIAAGVGAGAGMILLRGSLGGEASAGGASVSRGSVPNLIATGMEQGRYEAAAAEFDGAVDLSKLKFVATSATRKKHVALIHLESTRHSATTPYNPDLATTPYLTDLSKDSLLIERAYTTVPHTSKAVSSLISGLFPNPRTEIFEATPGGMPARCLPELLSEHGYRSAWFQSATKTFENRAEHVANLGYDHFAAFEDMPTEGFQPCNYLGYEDDIMLGPSREWLEENANDPTFVMYLGLTPHHQYLPVNRYGRKSFASGVFGRYLNNVHYDDFWVANLIEQYRELGLYSDTIFVIYGDHGEAFGEHGLTGHDGIPYEEGLRIPLVIHEPGNFEGGARLQGPVQL